MPKELERPMVKKIIGERKNAITTNPELLLIERWDHSDVFYAVRTRLNQQGYDVSIYGKDANRRKNLYDMIKPICENDFKVKRHKIGIFPKDRALMAFRGKTVAISFDNLKNLMHYGTDVIVVEKQGTVIKLAPFTEGLGLAFIQAEGFVTEYGVALAGLAVGQNHAAYHYTDDVFPKHTGHLGVLTDCDSSGLIIGIQIRNATRLGIGLDTIKEINDLNQGLGLEIEDLVEDCSVNTHWKGISNLLHGKENKIRWTLQEENFYVPYLKTEYDGVLFINWLKTHRIELNTILTVIKAQKFWNWLKWKIEQVWPDRNYNRAWYDLDDPMTPTMENFITQLHNTTKPVVASKYQAVKKSLTKVKGFLDIDEKEREIKKSFQKVLLKNDQIKGIDQALKQFIIDHNLAAVDIEEDDL